MSAAKISWMVLFLACAACRTMPSEPKTTESKSSIAERSPDSPAAAPAAAYPNTALTAAVLEGLLPLPSGPLELQGTDEDTRRSQMYLDDLITQMGTLTSVCFLRTLDVRASLGRIPTGLDRTLSVPPERAWQVFESLLRAHGYVLVLSSPAQPVILDVLSLMPSPSRPEGARRSVIYVAPEDLPNWKRHPAFLITTTAALDSINVRDLSNSLRQLFTDPNSQQIVPLGNSNTVTITGFAPNVADLVEVLQRVDRSERERIAREAQVSGEHAREPEANLGVTKKP